MSFAASWVEAQQVELMPAKRESLEEVPKEGGRNIIIKTLRFGMDPAHIASATGLSVERVNKLK